MRRDAQERDFAALLAWAEDYWTRATSSSFTGHSRIFETFERAKYRLRNRDEVLEFVAAL